MKKFLQGKIKNERKKAKIKRTYSTKAEARQKAFVEETIGKKGYGWYCIYDCKYIIQFKWSFSCSVVGLHPSIIRHSQLYFNYTCIIKKCLSEFDYKYIV